VAARVERHEPEMLGQRPDLRLKAEVALHEAVDQQDFRSLGPSPFVDGEAGAVGGADIAPRPVGQVLIRHFFSMFQCTTTGAFSQPTTLAREAPGPYQMPSQPYCAVSSMRFCTATASALFLTGSVSRA
jgi:hypothetical protein